MDTLQALQLGLFEIITSPETLVCLVLGVLGGIIFGAIPGLTAALGITLMLPFTYAMPASQGLTMLIAIYVGGITGGLVSAILLNIPGAPSNIATTFDGAPLARKGHPGLALSLGVFSSLIGGLISAVALVIIAPLLAKVALAFGAWEYFAVGVMGLCVVVALCSKDMIKGLMSAIIGMLLSTVGMDPLSSVGRFTFGFWQLNAGLDMLAVLMGLFAFAEIMNQLSKDENKGTMIAVEKIPFFPSKESLKGTKKIFGVASLIGIVIGILPGVGQATAGMLSYNQARQMSKNPEQFGTGTPEGIIASETANNAVCGGALVPMMTMGIPGDLATAILLGGLVIHGLQPGPLLFEHNPDIIGTIYVSYILACLVMFVLFMLLMRFFIRVISIPLYYLFPMLLLMCVVGAITSNNRIFDCWVLLIVGTVGYILLKSGFSLPPLILGYVLGTIIETKFRTAIIAARGDVTDLFTRPIALGLLAFGILMIVWPYIGRALRKKKQVTS